MESGLSRQSRSLGVLAFWLPCWCSVRHNISSGRLKTRIQNTRRDEETTTERSPDRAGRVIYTNGDAQGKQSSKIGGPALGVEAFEGTVRALVPNPHLPNFEADAQSVILNHSKVLTATLRTPYT